MENNQPQNSKNPDGFLTIRDLASFTDEVLLPGVERIVKDIVTDVVTDVVTEKVGNLENRVGRVEQEVGELRREMNERFETVNEKLDDLKASANALDDILEQHPIPRIERLEQNAHLQPYVHVFAEE